MTLHLSQISKSIRDAALGRDFTSSGRWHPRGSRRSKERQRAVRRILLRVMPGWNRPDFWAPFTEERTPFREDLE